MCLAIPAKIIELHEPDGAIVTIGGVSITINVSLIPGLNIGDYVIVHVGYALSKVDEVEAQKTLRLFAQMEALAPGGAE